MQISDSYKEYNQLLKNAAAQDLSTQDAKSAQSSTLKQLVDYVSQWKAGNIFAGTIQDISNHEVTIGLKSGEIVKAILNSEMALNIGDSLFFQVKSSDGSKIEITPLLQEQTFNPALLKALQAAGLSINANTLQMVQSMMEEQLPIDKTSLQMMAKAVLSFDNIDIPSAVELAKLNISVTPENASMLANYKMDQGLILNQIQEFAKEMQQLYGTSSENGSSNILMGLQRDLILSLFPELKGSFAENTVGQVIAAPNPSVTQMGTNTVSVTPTMPDMTAEGNLLQKISASGETVILNPVADNASIDLVLKDQTGQMNALNQRDTPVLTSQASQIILNHMNHTFENEIKQEDMNIVQEQVPKSQSGTKDITIGQNQLQQMTQTVNTLSQNQILSGLTPNEKQEFTNQFNQLLGTVFDGSKQISIHVTAKEFLGLLTQVLEQSPKFFTDIESFLNTSSYKKAFQVALQQQWMISPQNLNGDFQISDLYHKMQEQMNQIQQTLNNYGQGNTSLAHVVANIDSNIQFMNAVNQNYAYVQIPLKLRQQNAQAELFVYSNKRGGNKNQDEYSAFLHLDLQNLGSTDISVKLKGKNVNTIFYLPSESSYQLILVHASLLQERLKAKGYQCEVEVQKDQAKKDFVTDLLQREKPVKGEVHRYSFDVRA